MCSSIPPMSCTSYGIMFHSWSWPVTLGGADQAAARLAHSRECFGENLVQDFSRCLAELAFHSPASVETTQLRVDALALCGIRSVMLLGLELDDACLELAR